MTAFDQSRQSGKIAVRTIQSSLESNPTGQTCLSVRLWGTPEIEGQEGIPWNRSDPALCLILDMIAVSNGVLSASRGQLIVATFSGIEPAILTARRLQWAIQGFSESNNTSGTAIAVLVHDAYDLEDQEVDRLALLQLQQAEPGQVLVALRDRESLESLPSVQLQAIPESSLFQFMWRNPAIASGLSSDQEALSALIRRNGVEVEPPPLPREQIAEPVAPKTMTKAPGAYAPVGIEERPHRDDPVAFQQTNPRRIIGIGAGAVIVLVIAAFFVFSHRGGGKAQNTGTTPAAVDVSGTSSSGDQTPIDPVKSGSSSPQVQTSGVQSKVPKTPGTPNPKDRNQKRADKPSSGLDKAQGPVSQDNWGVCSLEASDIPTVLSQAENSRGAGAYDEASRKYKRVLACDRGNSKALSGLNLIRIAKEHE